MRNRGNWAGVIVRLPHRFRRALKYLSTVTFLLNFKSIGLRIDQFGSISSTLLNFKLSIGLRIDQFKDQPVCRFADASHISS